MSDFDLFAAVLYCGPFLEESKCPPACACHSMRAELARRGADLPALGRKADAVKRRLRSVPYRELEFMFVMPPEEGPDGPGLSTLAGVVLREIDRQC
jgi:hypothetical protein